MRFNDQQMTILFNRTKRNEGERLVSYLDTEGNWTIGIGHLLGKGDQFKGLTITAEKSYEYFLEDLNKTIRGINLKFPWAADLSFNRKAVLIDMAFQMGIGGLSKFFFLEDLQKGKYVAAYEKLLAAPNYNKKYSIRAAKNAELILMG